MKEYKYSADGGSIRIGNDNFSIRLSNDYGDGSFTVYIIDYDEMGRLLAQGYNLVGEIRGECNLYDYDGVVYEGKIITTLKGVYSIYIKSGTVILEKWGD